MVVGKGEDLGIGSLKKQILGTCISFVRYSILKTDYRYLLRAMYFPSLFVTVSHLCASWVMPLL